MANLDIIMTPFRHRDDGGIVVRVYTFVFICCFYKRKPRLFYKPSDNKGKQIFDFLFVSLDDEALQKGVLS